MRVFLIIIFFTSFVFTQEKSLHIIIVLDQFPHKVRPFIDNQIKSLIEHGHSITVMVTTSLKENNVPIPQQLMPYDIQLFYEKLPECISNANLIYCPFGMQAEMGLQLKDRFPSAKLVIGFRGYDVGIYVRHYEAKYKAIISQAELLLPVCDYFKQRLLKCGIDEKKIVVLHSTIDCNLFSYKEHDYIPGQELRIISTGRLIDKKGFEYSIKAIARLYKRHRNLRYYIIGTGKNRNNLVALINKLQARDYIYLLNAQSNDMVAQLLANAHIFVLTSVTSHSGNEEGIPNALKEAMARGLPVVSTYHAGIPELVEDGISGFLVPEKNVNALVERLEYLITHPQEWQRMGLAGRKKIEMEHDSKKENEKLHQLFVQLCQQ